MSNIVDHYQRLGLPRDATAEEIRAAYFDAARRLHPDANPAADARDLFIKVQAAYDILSNPAKRKIYDESLPGKLAPLSISTNIRYSRAQLPCMKEPQLVYALLELICTEDFDRSKAPPVHICLVVDRSTSMSGERIDMVKKNINQLLRKLSPNDRVSIIAFSDRAEVLVPPTRVGEMASIEQRVNLMYTSGGTELFKGLEGGVHQLRSYLKSDYGRYLILLTDGHTYGDEAACLDLVQKAYDENITVNAVGFGYEWNDAFLDQLTSRGGGNTTFGVKPGDLHNFLEAKLRSVQTAYARNLRIEFTLGEGVELRYAFRILPESGPLELQSPIPVGNLAYGRSVTLLLEFMVTEIPENTPEISLAAGKIWLDAANRSSPSRIFVELNRPVGSSSTPEPPPKALVDALARLTLYRLQEKASVEVKQGDITRATRHLQHLATHLLANGDRELAHTVLVEAEHIRQSHQFSSDGDKRIKYGTRALMLPSGLEQKS